MPFVSEPLPRSVLLTGSSLVQTTGGCTSPCVTQLEDAHGIRVLRGLLKLKLSSNHTFSLASPLYLGLSDCPECKLPIKAEGEATAQLQSHQAQACKNVDFPGSRTGRTSLVPDTCPSTQGRALLWSGVPHAHTGNAELTALGFF